MTTAARTAARTGRVNKHYRPAGTHTERAAMYRTRLAVIRSGGTLNGLDFSLKPPKAIRKAFTAVKKAVTLKNVAKVAAIGAGIVVGAPIIAAVGKAALPMLAKGVMSAAKTIVHPLDLIKRVGQAESAIGKSITGGITNLLPHESAPTADDVLKNAPPLSTDVDTLRRSVQDRVDQALRPSAPVPVTPTVSVPQPTYGPQYDEAFPAPTSSAQPGPGYPTPSTAGAGTPDDGSAAPGSGSAPGWLLPVAGLGVMLLLANRTPKLKGSRSRR